MANEYARVACDYIADTMSTDKPNIMSLALEPVNPVSPSRTRNILLGFGFGAVLAAVFLTIRFLADDKIKTSDEIRDCVGLATLAVVPIDESAEQGTKKEKTQRRKAQ